MQLEQDPEMNEAASWFAPVAPLDSPGPHARWLTGVWRFCVAAIWLKVAMNLTVRDEVSFLAILYYGLPTVFLAAAAAFLAWAGRRLSRSAYATWALRCLALAATIAWIHAEFRLGQEAAPPATSVRAVFWNIGRGHFAKWDVVAKSLGEFDADVLAIVEATSDKVQRAKYWKQRLPDYSPLPLDDGILLLVRGQATLREKGSLTDRGKFRRLEVEVRGVRFDLIMADIVSDPWLSRRPTLRKLWEQMQQQADRPTLVVGDFNTPPTSAWFDDWRDEWTRAWDSVGIGYQPTWPQPLPVLTLDHVWGNRWIRFHRCAGGWSNCSDHRPILFDFTVDRSMHQSSSVESTRSS
jgi:endonuclease/exonuclease/phosphatase (EEP) superfamily protein YafD